MQRTVKSCINWFLGWNSALKEKEWSTSCMHRHIINRKSQVTRSKGLLSLWPSAWKTIGCWPLGGPVNAFLLKMGPARPNIFGLSLRMLGSLLQTKVPHWPESESNLDREIRINARIRLFLLFLYFFLALTPIEFYTLFKSAQQPTRPTWMHS